MKRTIAVVLLCSAIAALAMDKPDSISYDQAIRNTMSLYGTTNTGERLTKEDIAYVMSLPRQIPVDWTTVTIDTNQRYILLSPDAKTLAMFEGVHRIWTVYDIRGK